MHIFQSIFDKWNFQIILKRGFIIYLDTKTYLRNLMFYLLNVTFHSHRKCRKVPDFPYAVTFLMTHLDKNSNTVTNTWSISIHSALTYHTFTLTPILIYPTPHITHIPYYESERVFEAEKLIQRVCKGLCWLGRASPVAWPYWRS